MKEKFNCFIVNIKLQSEVTGEERTKEYIRIINELSSRKKILKVGKNEAIQMYGGYGLREGKIPEFIYGSFAKGTYIDGEEISVIEEGEIKKDKNNPRLINPVVTEFIFIPKRHRLVIKKKSGAPSETQIEAYLNTFSPRYVKKPDILEVVLEKDSSVIHQIYSAESVYKISYEISYTNDDAIGIFGEELERQIKESKIGNLKLTAEADNTSDGLNMGESILLKGGLQLAEKDGTINSAKIKPEKGGKIITISNKDKPKVIPIDVDQSLGSWYRQWYNKIINLL
ncbi:hypothetical protein D3C87_272560 [compost metagenome]